MSAVTALCDAELREQLRRLLEGGIETFWWRRAGDSEQVAEVVRSLCQVPRNDLVARLRTAGFTAHPFRPTGDAELEHACKNCIYYDRSRQYCNQPELALPVSPHWSCVLWRI